MGLLNKIKSIFKKEVNNTPITEQTDLNGIDAGGSYQIINNSLTDGNEISGNISWSKVSPDPNYTAYLGSDVMHITAGIIDASKINVAVLHKDIVISNKEIDRLKRSYKNSELNRLSRLLNRTKNKRIKNKLRKRINILTSGWIIGVDTAKSSDKVFVSHWNSLKGTYETSTVTTAK